MLARKGISFAILGAGTVGDVAFEVLEGQAPSCLAWVELIGVPDVIRVLVVSPDQEGFGSSL